MEAQSADAGAGALVILLWLLVGVVVAVVASKKGRNAFLWFLYGFLVPPVALVHVLLAGKPAAAQPASEERIPCPACREMIRPGALKCPFCGNQLVQF